MSSVDGDRGGGSEFQRSLGDAENDAADRKARARHSANDKVRFRLRNGWRNDESVLNQYFQSVVANWKMYQGEKKAHQILKLQSIYRQATLGDNAAPPPENIKSTAGLKWQAWTALKGTSQIVAKRRFITYLAEINPMLIDVMPDEKPPDGFPQNKHGETICAKCNTATGCSRPLLDSNKVDLKKQLFDFEYLHEPAALQKWIKHAMETQRCVWGVHMAIARVDIKPFQAWFDREENGGYIAYDSNTVFDMVRELLHYHFELAWDMQQNKDEYGAEAFNHQVSKVNRLQAIYEQVSGERFVFEAPCKQNIVVCNDRRKGDGGRNHTHPVELDQPTHKDVATYDEVLELRTQCKNLGLSITTGIVQNVQERRDIYRRRISDHFQAAITAGKAKERNDARAEIHQAEKKKVSELSGSMLVRQCWDACHAMKMDRVLTLIRRGCDPNVESPRGLTPFLCAVLTGATSDDFDELIRRKADINAVNRYGLTALILACRLKDTKIIHVLMRSGASALQDGGRKGGGRTAIHACAEHGSEEELRVILDYVKDGGGDSLRIVRLLDAQSDNGDTALMLAARIRNGVMCRVLTSLGANPNIRNAQSRNACYIARSAGWTELADWLEKKVGAGVAKLETFSDLQYDKTVRYGAIKAKEAVEEFGTAFLKLVHKSTTQSPLGPPSVAQVTVAECGDRAIQEQTALLDRHQMHIHRRDREGRVFTGTPGGESQGLLTLLRERVDFMYDSIRKGVMGPNTEAAAKPLPWTPLMCAVAINDVRKVKLMIRDGSDPNYRNRDGMTSVMLAAEIQCIEVLVEMLTMGADLNLADNQGYTALAYANALPLPSNMQQDGVAVLLGEDTDGPKKIDSAAILKMAQKCGVGDLRRRVEENAMEASRDSVIGHFQFMRLLEAAGMKRMETLRHIHEQVVTADWRIEASDDDKRRRDNFSETSSEARERELYEKRLKVTNLDEDTSLRCPVCTLTLPCAHFFKVDILKAYLAKQEKENGTTGSKFLDAIAAAQERMKGRKLKQASAQQAILDEAGIGDRRTDRSVTLMKKYRLKEMELDRQLLLRIDYQRGEEERLRLEQEKADAKARAIADGSYREWQEFYNTHGQKFFVHWDTGEKWEEHIGTDGKPYYHNTDTGESKWDSPVPKEVLTIAAEETKGEIVEVAEVKEVRLSIMGAEDTSEKALAHLELDLSGVKSVEPAGPPTARKTYSIGKGLKSRLKNAGDVFFVGDDGMATALIPNAELEPLPKKLKGRKVVFQDIPGDEEEPFEYLNLEDLLVIPWNDLAHNSDPVVTVEDKSTVVEQEGSGFTVESKSPVELSSGVFLGVDDDLESIRSGSSMSSVTSAFASSSSSSPSSSSSSSSAVEKVDTSDLLLPSESDETTYQAPDLTAEKLKKMATNPLPPNDRRLFMFTADPISRFGQSDGLLFSAKTVRSAPEDTKGVVSRLRRLGTPVPMHLVRALQKEQADDEEEKVREATRVARNEKPTPKRWYPNTTKETSRQPQEDPNIQISGWLFISVAAIETSTTPHERVALKPDVWAHILEHVRCKLLLDWLPRMTLEPLVSGKTWKVDAPRCSVCAIGFVRFSNEKRENELFKNAKPSVTEKLTVVGNTVYDHSTSVWSSTSSDGSFVYSEFNLCFPCLVRRELYEHVQATFPRTQRKKFASNPVMQWPFKAAAEFGISSVASNVSESSFQATPLNDVAAGSFSTLPSASSFNTFNSSYSDILSMEGRGSSVLDITAGFGSTGNLNALKSPIASKKLAMIDSMELMRRSGQNLTIGLGDDDSLSVGSASMLSDADIMYIDDLLDVGSTGSVGGGPDSPTSSGRRGRGSKGSKGSMWDEPNEEDRIKPEKKSFLKQLQFGKKKESLFTNKSNTSAGHSLSTGGPTSLSLVSIPSDFSGSTAEGRVPDKADKRRPPEVLLLPFLVSRGHFEEVERIVRVSISQKNVDEGEGMLMLLKIFHVQADMYKLMGLWPLALAIYLDCVDLTAGIIGFDDPGTINATVCVSSCLRKMHMAAEAKSFIQNFNYRLEEETFGQRTFRASKLILEADRRFKKVFMKADHIWTKFVAPDRPEKPTGRIYHQELWDTVGLGALFRTMTAVDGFGVVARAAFFDHCDRIDPQFLGRFAQFVAYCFRLRSCDSPEIYRHLVQTLIQKHLAKALVKTSDVARLYRQVTPPEHIHAVLAFLKQGISVTVDVFDDMLYHALRVLAPAFKIFYLRHGAAGMRDHFVDNTAKALHCCSIIIQLCWRSKLARLCVMKRRAALSAAGSKGEEEGA